MQLADGFSQNRQYELPFPDNGQEKPSLKNADTSRNSGNASKREFVGCGKRKAQEKISCAKVIWRIQSRGFRG
ncbi:MAG TPA: hypothetical protein DCE08_04615 [Ruminococcaceae bacterium]|nr:hypothetical protein [Oscillospiraceae bacterium]